MQNRIWLIITFFALFCLSAGPVPAWAATGWAPAMILADDPSYPLAGHLAVLDDPEGDLELIDVLTPAAEFTPLAGNLRRGYTTGVIWLRFILHPTDHFPAPGFLRLAPAYLDNVQVFIQTGPDYQRPDAYQRYQLGDLQPARNRPLLHPHFVVPLNHHHRHQATPTRVYLRVENRGPIDLYGAVHNVAGLTAQTHHNALIHGGYLVATLAIALINLVYFVRVRDPIFSSFAAFLLVLFTIYLGNSGMIVPLLPKLSHHFSNQLMEISVGLSFCTIAVFATHLFQTRHLPPLVHRSLQYFFLFGLVMAGSVLLDRYHFVARTMPAHGLLLITLLTVLSIYLVRRGEVGARIYLAALLLGNLGYAISFLQLQGVIGLMAHPTHLLQASSLVQMVLMSLGFTERLRAAEARALEASRRSTEEARQMAWQMTRQYRQKQRELEAALRRESETSDNQSRLVATLAHEYRTPLAVISTNLDILLAKSEKSAIDHEECRQAVPMLHKMKKAVGRLVEVMENARTLLRLDDYLGDIKCHPLELNRHLREIVEENRELWPSRQLRLSLPGGQILVAGAEPLTKTMILNLLDNACKYSPPGGQVQIKLEENAARALIKISDTGPGLNEQERHAIFHKFFRGEAGNNRGGDGLGLYLAKRIIEQHGGEITMANNHPAPGLTVAISLPKLARNPATTGNHRQEEEKNEPPTQPHHPGGRRPGSA